MNELIGIKKKEEEPQNNKEINQHVEEPQKPPVEEPQKPPVEEPKQVPVPVQPSNPIFSFIQTPVDEVLRIEKIEINPETETDKIEDYGEMDIEPNEYVIFRIYSPYYEIYKTIFTENYLKSIGLTTERDGMIGGGVEKEQTFPYNIFNSIFNNTFGRLGYMFQPKKESLAEETMKKRENILASVANFKTDELLKPQEYKLLDNTDLEFKTDNTPPYYEIKIPKSGLVLSQKEYNEQKQRETNDEILEHDENGKTFQEILLETKQDEIQRTRKQTLLSILDVPLPPDFSGNVIENIVEKIKRLERNSLSDEKIWFIRQKIYSENEDYSILQKEPSYKWVKLNLSLL